MPSIQLLRKRIRSIANTRQITKAMELVAASKMRRAQAATLASRPYASEGWAIIETLAKTVNRDAHPLLQAREPKKILLLVVTADRGLAGAYNTMIIRQTNQLIQEKPTDQSIEILAIGKKIVDYLSRVRLPAGVRLHATFTHLPTQPTIFYVRPIGKIAVDGFTTNQYDQITIIYTHFFSTIKQTVVVSQLLPITTSPSGTNSPQPIQPSASLNGELANNQTIEYQFEPDRDGILEFILPRMIEAKLYQTILEAIASEHSARMVAMKNASDNANELINDLRLTFNTLRQAKITQELIEITTGAEVLS